VANEVTGTFFNVLFWGLGKWRSRGGLRLEHESVTLACAAALVKKKIYRDLVDFDNHLDDITQVNCPLAAGQMLTVFTAFLGPDPYRSDLNWLS
jgi:hypothetical protein